MKTKLIIFDFDGTLGDTRKNIVTTMQMTIAELGLPKRSDHACASTIGLPLTSCFKVLYPDLQEEHAQHCANTYRRIFNENLRTIKPQVFPHVPETLSALKERGNVLTIASSRSHASLAELTKDLGLKNSITFLIGADDVEKAKPHPEPVQKTLAALQFDAREALVVGDMAVDIQMGMNAGTKTCGVTWGNGSRKDLEEAGADYIIDSMVDLTGIVESLRKA